MVSRLDSAMQIIYAQRRARRQSKVEDKDAQIAAMEAQSGPPMTEEQAEKLLARMGVNVVEMTRGELLLEAVFLGLKNVVRALQTPQYRLNYVNSFGEGVLHYAAKANQDKMVTYLLLRGADPNIMNRFEETPIFSAAEMGSKEVLDILMSDKRTKFESCNKFGETILHFAARDGQFECLKYILERCKPLTNRTDQEGKTALAIAQENGHMQCYMFMYNMGAKYRSGEREEVIDQMTQKLLDAHPDYQKSVISRQKDLVEYRIPQLDKDKPLMGRHEVMLEQVVQRKALQFNLIKQKFEQGEEFEDDAETRITLRSIQKRYDEIEKMNDELISFRSPTKMSEYQ